MILLAVEAPGPAAAARGPTLVFSFTDRLC